MVPVSPFSSYDPVNVPISALNGKFEHAECLGMIIPGNYPLELADVTGKNIKQTSLSRHVYFLPSLAHTMIIKPHVR